MNLPSASMWAAGGRHVVSYSAGAATVLAGVAGIVYSMHGLTLDQVNQLSSAGKTLVSGITSVVGAIGTIAVVLSSAWAAYTASRGAQVASVAAIPGTTIVTTPEIAAAAPANVVSNVENKVDAK